ncbi:MAG: lactonase family protein [Steroidobacteraceae bacterium]|jgi:6-phosphogluconolactonase
MARIHSCRTAFAPLAAALALTLHALMPSANAATVVYVGNADSQDLSLFALAADGGLNPLATVVLQRPAHPGRSMLLAVSPDHGFLYAGFFSSDEKHSVVTSYSIDPKSGMLTPRGSTQLADIMSYISTDRSGRYLLSASYGGNKVSVNSIGRDGVVADTLQIIPTEPKAHCILADPTNRFVLHTALGGDVVYQQRFDAKTGRLSPAIPPTVGVPANAGPRFFIFSRDGRYVYLIDELDGAIRVFPFDPATGALQPQVQVASALPAGFTGQAWGADIHLTPDGRFLYVSERTSSTLGAFRVEPERGTLTAIETVATVKQPRAFNIDPAGRYLVSSGQLSNSVMTYAIDRGSGKLTALKEYPVGLNPTWVEIVSLP